MAGPFDPYAAWLGIQHTQRPLTNYQLLGLDTFESNGEIIECSAQQQLAKLTQFTKTEQGLLARRIIFEIESAKTCLLNPVKKTAYDNGLRSRVSPASCDEPPHRTEITKRHAGVAQPPALPIALAPPSAVTVGSSADFVAKPPECNVLKTQTGSPSRQQAAQTTRTTGVSLDLRAESPTIPAIPNIETSPKFAPLVIMLQKNNRVQYTWAAIGVGLALALITVFVSLAIKRSHTNATSQHGNALAQAIEQSGRPQPITEPSTSKASEAVEPLLTGSSLHPGVKPSTKQRPVMTANNMSVASVDRVPVPLSHSSFHVESSSGHDVRSGESLAVNRSDLIDRVKPCVVQITTDAGQGSGFIIDGRGLIVTNYHVIANATKAIATFNDGRSLKIAGYVALNKGHDLVVLRVLATAHMEAIPVRIGRPRNNEGVLAFGSRKGFGLTASEGIVSAVRAGREVQEMVGEAPSASELDPETEWIQTTATISEGNSGGPLIAADGKVIGVNTWCKKDGNNLNFAVSAEHIAQLVRNISNRPYPLEAIAGTSRPPYPVTTPWENNDKEQPSVNITLPSGATLTEAMLTLPESWKENLFPDESEVYVANFPNGNTQGIFSLRKGKLQGAAATFHENEKLQTLASYANANLNGPLRLWNDNGDRLLYACYQNGKKHGVVCFFRTGVPMLIHECDKGKLRSEYLVKLVESEWRVVAVAQMNADESKEYHTAAEQLSTLERNLRQNEATLKNTLVGWYRKAEKGARQEQFVNQAPARRAASSARIQSHNAEKADAMKSNWHSALRRSGM